MLLLYSKMFNSNFAATLCDIVGNHMMSETQRRQELFGTKCPSGGLADNYLLHRDTWAKPLADSQHQSRQLAYKADRRETNCSFALMNLTHTRKISNRFNVIHLRSLTLNDFW